MLGGKTWMRDSGHESRMLNYKASLEVLQDDYPYDYPYNRTASWRGDPSASGIFENHFKQLIYWDLTLKDKATFSVKYRNILRQKR